MCLVFGLKREKKILIAARHTSFSITFFVFVFISTKPIWRVFVFGSRKNTTFTMALALADCHLHNYCDPIFLILHMKYTVCVCYLIICRIFLVHSHRLFIFFFIFRSYFVKSVFRLSCMHALTCVKIYTKLLLFNAVLNSITRIHIYLITNNRITRLYHIASIANYSVNKKSQCEKYGIFIRCRRCGWCAFYRWFHEKKAEISDEIMNLPQWMRRKKAKFDIKREICSFLSVHREKRLRSRTHKEIKYAYNE